MRNNMVYYLSRLRLINYQGVTDETVEIKNGAHLLLACPDRRSGVTMLDCICAALTGVTGEEDFSALLALDPEFYSGDAAKRRFYYFNVPTGSGPTYLALELTGDRGKRYTLALGMACGRGRSVSTWGAVIEAPVGKVDFWTTTQGDFMPRDAKQLQELLTGKKVFRRIDSYRRKIAEKFFGGEDNLAAFCRAAMLGRFWSSQSLRRGDFGRRLNRLLPALPPVSVEQVGPAYRRMMVMRRRLDQVQLHSARLAAFKEVVAAVTEWRQELALCEAAGILLRQNYATVQEKSLQVEFESLQKQLEECRLERERGVEIVKSSRCRQPDYRQLSASLAAMIMSRLKTAEPEPAVKPRRRGRPAGGTNLAAMGMKAVIAEVVAGLDAGVGCGVKTDDLRRVLLLGQDDPLQLVLAPAWDELNEALISEVVRLAGEKNHADRELDNLLEREEELQMEIIELEKYPEAQPEVNYYADAVIALEKASVDFLPLYQGLEWRHETDIEDRSRIEEFMGHSLLSTLIIAEEDYPRASEMILREYPGIKIACARVDDKPSTKFMKWVGKYFNTETSDLHSLAVLDKELAGGGMPSFIDRNEQSWYEGRAHAAAFFLMEPYLIGAESRRVAQARKIEEREEELNAAVKEINRLKKETKTLAERLKESRAMVTAVSRYRATVLEAWWRSVSASVAGGNVVCSAVEMEQEIFKLLESSAVPAVKAGRGKKAVVAAEQPNAWTELVRREISLEYELERLQGLLEQHRRDRRSIGKQWRLVCERLNADFAISEPDEMVVGLCQCHSWENAAEAERQCEHLRGRLAAAREVINRALAQGGDSLCRHGVYDEATNVLLLDGKPLAETEQHLLANRDLIRNELEKAAAGVVDQLIDTGVLTAVQELQSTIREIGRYVNSCLERLAAVGGVKLMVELQPDEERYRSLDSIIARYVSYNRNSEQALKDWLIQEGGEADDDEVVLDRLYQLLDCRNWYCWRICTRNGGRGRTRNAEEPEMAAVIGLLAVFAFRCRESGVRLPILTADILYDHIAPELRGILLEQACDLGLQLVVTVPDDEVQGDGISLPASVVYNVSARKTMAISGHGGDEDSDHSGLLPGFDFSG